MDQITMQIPSTLGFGSLGSCTWVVFLSLFAIKLIFLCAKKIPQPCTTSTETIPFHLPLEENSMLFHKSIQGFMHEKGQYQHARNKNNNSTLIGAFQEI
jgi:hypothetical protein